MVLSFIFAKIIGMPGAAIGSVVAGMIGLYRVDRRMVYIYKINLGSTQYWLDLIALLLLSLVAGTLTFIFEQSYLSDYTLISRLLLSGVVLGIIYLLSLLLSGKYMRLERLFAGNIVEFNR